MRKIVRLWDAVGTGLIILCDSGIEYTNQTGGTACFQSSAEGVYVPYQNDVALPGLTLLSVANDLSNYFTGTKHGGAGATGGLDSEDTEMIDQLFAAFTPGVVVKVDRTRLHDSHEAWVYVDLLASEQNPALTLFAGLGTLPLKAILTWSNSD